jgi:hypothetical protein
MTPPTKPTDATTTTTTSPPPAYLKQDLTTIKTYDLESDLESGTLTPHSPTTTLHYTSSPPCTSRVCDAHLKPNGDTHSCSVWPSPTMLKQRKREDKRRMRWRGCSPLAGLTKKQKIWVKIVFAMCVIGAAVAIGIGVSKAVGGRVSTGDGQTKPIWSG